MGSLSAPCNHVAGTATPRNARIIPIITEPELLEEESGSGHSPLFTPSICFFRCSTFESHVLIVASHCFSASVFDFVGAPVVGLRVVGASVELEVGLEVGLAVVGASVGRRRWAHRWCLCWCLCWYITSTAFTDTASNPGRFCK